MKIKSSTAISLAISLFSLIILFAFRTIPVSRLWKGYQVLYVFSNDLGESEVLSILEKNGCINVVSASRQQLPVVSPVSPVQVQTSESYYYKRFSFFTDKTSTASVFYIPDQEAKGLEKAMFEISAFQGTSCGTDGKSSFPWIAPILSVFFALVLLYFAKNRLLFAVGSIFPVILAFSRPLYTVSSASIFTFFALFLLCKIWKRKDFIKTFGNSIYTTVFAFAPFLLLLFSSPVNALFFVLTILAVSSSLYLYSQWEDNKLSSLSFKPVFIRTSKMIPLIGKNGIRLMGAMCFSLVLLTLVYNLFGKISDVGINASSPSLPSPVSATASELPDMTDVMEWSWNTITFPYRKINLSEQLPPPAEGEAVYITDYIENNGVITSYETPVYVYNSKFRDSVYSQIEGADSSSLEKMMLKQGKKTFYGYSKGSLSSAERFGTIILGVFILISFALSLYYIVGRKRYGLSI